MDHIAFDLGSRESQICRRNSEGVTLDERRVRMTKLEEYLARLQPSRVIVETCTEAFAVAEAALGPQSAARDYRQAISPRTISN
jgi:hypothetical protein